MIFTLNYLVWRIFFTMPQQHGKWSVVMWAILLVAECAGLLEMAVHFYNMYNYDQMDLAMPKMAKADFPEVDVFVPTVNEESSLLEKTLYACKRMEYPKKKYISIYAMTVIGQRSENWQKDWVFFIWYGKNTRMPKQEISIMH